MVRRQTRTAILEWMSIACLVAGVILLVFQLVAYSRARTTMPLGLQIAGVPVGGLSQSDALEQLATAYSIPVELHYRGKIIVLDPSLISFRLDTETMMAAAGTYQTETAFWPGFWDYLWRRPGGAHSIDLRAEYSETQLREFLQDIAARYDEPPTAAQPIPGTINFKPGSPGFILDLDTSAQAIGTALLTPSNRRVALVISEGDEGRPTLDTLGTLLRQQIAFHQFKGLASIMVVDLQTGKELHMNYRDGADLSTDPDIAFAAMSIMKSAIMVQFYKDLDRLPFPYESDLIDKMMLQSSNFAPNALLDWIGEDNRVAGLQRLNETLTVLGLENSFMAGWYDDDAPVQTPVTPANSRADITTFPDKYMQTTSSDMGTLFMDVYQCAKGGGAFEAAFPGRLTPEECTTMLDYLSRNKIGVLIEAGVPEGTRVAHKHGWIEDTKGDVGIVFTPGGDYVLAMLLYEDQTLPWDQASTLMADLSRAVYNYFNPPN